ncbi:hypothetical protein ACIA8C_09925 [Nocardia sp. NPDC051321]|uniref:hypothetical protein n=1 Tax=Nocardia sp. NPDC051321 TaxID=3364323 RepID=UPI0037A69BAE
MSWLDRRGGANNPEHYPDAASADEAQLRADAAHWYSLLLVSEFAESPQQRAEFKSQAGQLAAKWSRNPSVAHRIQWTRLRDAFREWENSPDQAAQELRKLERAHAANADGVDEIGLRNLRQAGEQTGHLEPGVTGSEQDSARWQPVTPAASANRAPSTDRGIGRADANAAAATPWGRNVLDRALGTVQSMLDPEEVGAIIAGSDQHRETAEELGTLDIEESAAIPDQARTTPAGEATRLQRAALQVLQDLYAEHTRTVEAINDLAPDSVEYNLTKVAELERISARYRSARVVAARIGAPAEVIKSVSLAGQAGTYWEDGPGDPRLDLTDPSLMPLDHAPEPHASLGAPDPSALATATPNGGVAIGQAVDAASTDAEHADWHTPETPDVSRSTPTHEVVKGVEL